jgi:hypothetical protein
MWNNDVVYKFLDETTFKKEIKHKMNQDQFNTYNEEQMHFNKLIEKSKVALKNKNEKVIEKMIAELQEHVNVVH